MSKPCKDCKDCKDCVKYNIIKRPNYYTMGVDKEKVFFYYIPVNTAATIDGVQDYYIGSSVDFIVDSGISAPNQKRASIYGYSLYDNINNAVDDIVNDVNGTIPNDVDLIEIIIDNPNYGNLISTDPSFLYQEWEPFKIPYDSLKDPNWLISFPICSLKNKFETNKEWNLKDCGIWKVEYRLRVRPIIPLNFNWFDGRPPCEDYGIKIRHQFETDIDYKYVKEIMQFYKSLEAQEGSKALGIAPMRIESGIYSHDTLKYKPVVWSEGGYPQVLPNERLYWTSKYPKEMSYADVNNPSSITNEPFCDRKKWFIGANAEVQIDAFSSNPNEDEIFYLYDSSVSSDITDKKFKVDNNSLVSPNSLTFALSDILGSSSLLKWVESFNLSGNGVKVGELQIEIEGNLNGQWTRSTILNYDVTTITINNDSIVLDVSSNSSNPIFENNIGTGHSSTEFYNFDSLKTRYSISLINYIPAKTISTFDFNNIQEKTFTPLTEDFVFEIEGFTHVDLDKEKDISIYLKVLPEHNDYGSGEIDYVHTFQNITQLVNGQPWYSTVNGNANILSAPTVSGFWPWAPLSMDFRNDYTENLNVKYEPFLPRDLDREERRIGGHIQITSTESDAIFRKNYGFSNNTKGWFIMIEEGWVRAEKVCEDCDC